MRAAMAEKALAPDIRLSESGCELIVDGRSHGVPYALQRSEIGPLVEALAFYGFEANHVSRGDKMPAIWADDGRRAREALLSICVIKDVAELEEDL